MTFYLNDHVTLETLSREPDALGRFQSGDDRGEVAMVLARTEVHHVEIAIFAAAQVVRGFHYHKTVCKRFYVMQGRLRFAACRVEDPAEKLTITLTVGHLLTVQPLTAHAFLSLEKSQLLMMATGAYPFDDRERYEGLCFDAMVSA